MPVLALILAAWCGAAGGWEATLGFEPGAAWHTAPPLLETFTIDELRLDQAKFDELDSGLTLTPDHAVDGQSAGRWADHPNYPTLWTREVPADWRGAGVGLAVHSAVATGQLLTLALLADNPATPWRDFWVANLRLDWAGPRAVQLPTAAFAPLGSPLGWDQISELHFFTRIWERQPHPATVLHLDAIGPLAQVDRDDSAPPAGPPAGGLPLHRSLPQFDPSRLNHPGPELSRPATTPIRYDYYFRHERALFGYHPRFQPGFVSFDPSGRPYLIHAATVLQWLGDDGQWQARDLLPEVVEPYAREVLGFDALAVVESGQVNDASLRFDDAGDAYLLLYIHDPTRDWKSRTGLLLHSRDGLRTWDVHKLPWYMARFEKFTGHNVDGLRRPPVLLLSRYFAPTELFLMLPEKQADGRLSLGELVKVTDGGMGWTPHSGEANLAITHGDQVFLVYGRIGPPPGKTKEDGVPAYAVVYDIPSRTLSEPVLLGFGGRNAEDDHNWPSLAVDAEGILHVVICGHHDPFRYVHSLRPWDISAWTEPVAEAKGTTYNGLLVGPDGTLHSVSRCSDPGYYFRLSYHRRPPGGPWEPTQHLVHPFKPYYKVWFHKLVIQPGTGRLFLAYHAQSPSNCLFLDEFIAQVHLWPHREQDYLSQHETPTRPQGSARTEQRKYEFYRSPATETCILVSDDAGASWRLATTPDFAAP